MPIHYEGFASNLGELGRFASGLAQIGTTAGLLLPEACLLRWHRVFNEE